MLVGAPESKGGLVGPRKTTEAEVPGLMGAPE